jgi:hypothetical protein
MAIPQSVKMGGERLPWISFSKSLKKDYSKEIYSYFL